LIRFILSKLLLLLIESAQKKTTTGRLAASPLCQCAR
jgi:hypothetical protein